MFLLLLTVTACKPQVGNQPSGEQEQAATPSQGEIAKDDQKTNLPVYYVKITADDAYLVREVHQVPYTKEVIKAALEELINTNPVTPGAVRVLPAGTKIRGISVQDGLATVDFSRDVLRANVGASGEELGIQSIINTVTEFPGVQKVSFLVEGTVDQEAKNWWGHVGLYSQPFARDVAKVYEPAIWLTSPAPDQVVASPLEVRGSARVFEATVSARLLDDSGKELASGFATAAQGAPGRGDFVLPLKYQVNSPGKGKVEVYWKSPKDGKEMDKVVIPVAW
ncbi:GerMN domain-containing protein [Pelotomaculum isophthalicicum JI]|uniref:GerMN domain-containing protein n=1 Tax=Pelotomaculum isophthalicicum JI TaxID=947010 RepID=A0A9X4H5E5_9FIRM|nr:Gmad2 immunoglobulin-like domain-containing protein [Pelotomaculum isophthalicicum]MDF9408063.1 GerMN domain-containing protein [Pelotomaculum isophthalicicum JI]